MRTDIPVTTVARTLLDLAEVVDRRMLERAFGEAERRGLLKLAELERVCAAARGRRGLKPLRRLMAEAGRPRGRTPLEDKVLALCYKHRLPIPETNVIVLGCEVDCFWPDQKLMVEADSFEFHAHRSAFERDRERDAEMQVAGYHVMRLTHRRLEREPAKVAAQLRHLLGRGVRQQRGQGTVEWVGLVAVVALLLVGLAAAGTRVPGGELAWAVASKMLCAVALADSCGDEPELIAAYGTEVGRLVRRHMPSIAFERGSRALPIDFRRCRHSACGDGSARGLVDHTDAGLPVTAFVHVIDCREPDDPAVDCSGPRAGNLYLQYWLYYADSATMRGILVAGAAGYHRDDWESVQVRIGGDGRVDERASSHHGYNHAGGLANAGSDAGIGIVRTTAERAGARPSNGWGAQNGLLRVSGGSHAGSASGYFDFDRIVPAARIRLVPLEPIGATGAPYRFAVFPPWRKRVWRDPETATTD